MSEKKSLSAGKPDEGDNFGSHLNQSLSAAFFKKLTKSEAKSSDSKSSHDYAVSFKQDHFLS